MAIEQRISINKPLTSRNKIVVRDDTGVFTMSNETGYGGTNGNPVGSILKYIFEVKDKIKGTSSKKVFGDGVSEVKNPTVQRIAYREDVDLVPEGKYPDSVYDVTMTTVMDFEYDGTGIKGQDFIINVPGTSIIENYNAIIAPDGNIYKIRSVKKGVVFLDRLIEEAFEYFNVGLQVTSEPIVIYQSLEDCLTSKIIDFLDSEECNTRITNNINELRMLYWGLQFSMEKGDYNQSFKYMQQVQNICGFLNCGCNG